MTGLIILTGSNASNASKLVEPFKFDDILEEYGYKNLIDDEDEDFDNTDKIIEPFSID